MSRSQIVAHYARVLMRWPKDPLRPETNFTSVLSARLQHPPTPFRSEDKEVNAAYLLLENTFTKQYAIPERLRKPESSPRHYIDLKKALDEAPELGFWGRLQKRLSGMVRMK